MEGTLAAVAVALGATAAHAAIMTETVHALPAALSG